MCPRDLFFSGQLGLPDGTGLKQPPKYPTGLGPCVLSPPIPILTSQQAPHHNHRLFMATVVFGSIPSLNKWGSVNGTLNKELQAFL